MLQKMVAAWGRISPPYPKRDKKARKTWPGVSG